MKRSGASAERRILPAAALRRRVIGCLPTAATRFDFWLFFRFLKSYFSSESNFNVNVTGLLLVCCRFCCHLSC